MSKVQKNVVNIAARNLSDRRYLPKKIPSKKTYDRKKMEKM